MVGTAVGSLDHAEDMVDVGDGIPEDGAEDTLMAAAAAKGASCPAGKSVMLQLAAFSR